MKGYQDTWAHREKRHPGTRAKGRPGVLGQTDFRAWSHRCGPAFFDHVRPHSMWARLRFFVMLLENHLKKRFGVATYFCFILKGKNKIRKKNPKCDS